MDRAVIADELTDWIPIRVYWQDERLLVDWCRLDGEGFHEPFFDDTVRRLLQRPFNLLFRRQTSIEALSEFRAARPGLTPTGFIFHTSRCGSTLMAQMLAALPENVVISEADPIDSVLRARYQDSALTGEQRAEWLRGVVSALGQRRRPEHSHLFIKFDSWSLLELPTIRRAFPSVPWVFVYRDPVEVLASHMRQPGVHMVPGMIEPEVFGLMRADLVEMRAEEYRAQVLRTICEAALRNYDDGCGALVNYVDLPQAVWSCAAPHFGLTWTDAERTMVSEAAGPDVKNPWRQFQPDASAKRREASDALREITARWVLPAYDRLETLRSSHRATASLSGDQRS